MRDHLRANLWLLGLTVLLCSVLYPLTLLGVGQALFRDQAQGSLLRDDDGNVVGSKLIAQNFTGKEYFWPRPSAAGYNGAASGAYNWGASSPLLRNRIARQLGPIVRYGDGAQKHGKKPGALVGPDVEKWFLADKYGGKPGIVKQWLEMNPSLAEAWVKDAGDALKEQTGKETPGAAFAAQWQADFPEQYARWKRQNPGKDDPSPADLAKPFFEGFIADKDHPGAWPILDDVKEGDKTVKKIVPLRDEKEENKKAEIQAAFFDLWVRDNPHLPLKQVPADMVMASGSGLDPHITADNARYQARYRLADEWADRIGKEKKRQLSEQQREKISSEIFKLIDEHSAAPMWGLAGVPLVNVLELNLALRKRMTQLSEKFE